MKDPIKLKRPENYYIRKLLKDVKLKEIMTDRIVTVHVDALFSEVAEKLTNHGFRHLPIINDEKQLVGLITERDLFKIQAPRRLEDGSWYFDKDMLDAVILRTVMTQNPFTMHPDDSLGEAVVQMVRKKYGCIPVVDQNGRLCGIITQMDILKIAAQIYLE